MLKIAAKTKLSPEETIKRAIAFFGPGGYGLEVKAQKADCVYFEGGGGGVEVTASMGKEGTSVELESQEWDYQAKEFTHTIS
jgi:hypothetical protein